MNTNTSTAAADSLKGLKNLITEFELDRRDDYYGLSDKELAFADACCSGNTIDELAMALRDGSGHWTCAGDCEAWDLARSEWLAGIKGALADKVFRRLEELE